MPELTKHQVEQANDVLREIRPEVEKRGRKLRYRDGLFEITGEVQGTFNLVGVWEWLNGKGAPTGS